MSVRSHLMGKILDNNLCPKEKHEIYLMNTVHLSVICLSVICLVHLFICLHICLSVCLALVCLLPHWTHCCLETLRENWTEAPDHTVRRETWQKDIQSNSNTTETERYKNTKISYSNLLLHVRTNAACVQLLLILRGFNQRDDPAHITNTTDLWQTLTE